MGCSTTTSFPHRAVSGDLGLGLHYITLKAIRSLGSEEQIAKWAPLCDKFQIITTYAQTELGHGEPQLLHAVHSARAHSGLRSQICMLNVETLVQMADKGLEEGVVSF